MWLWVAAVIAGRRLFIYFLFSFHHFTCVWEGRWSSMRHIYIYINIFWHTLPVFYCCISDTAVHFFPWDVCCGHAIKSPWHVGPLDLANSEKKARCVWFVYVGASSLTSHSVIFRLYMSLSAAFMSPLIPSYCTGRLWTAMQVALCIKHTATGHRYHYYIHDHHSGRLIIWEPQKIHSNTCSWAHLHSRHCCF